MENTCLLNLVQLRWNIPLHESQIIRSSSYSDTSCLHVIQKLTLTEDCVGVLHAVESSLLSIKSSLAVFEMLLWGSFCLLALAERNCFGGPGRCPVIPSNKRQNILYWQMKNSSQSATTKRENPLFHFCIPFDHNQRWYLAQPECPSLKNHRSRPSSNNMRQEKGKLFGLSSRKTALLRGQQLRYKWYSQKFWKQSVSA